MQKRVFSISFMLISMVVCIHSLTYFLHNHILCERSFLHELESAMQSSLIGKDDLKEIYGAVNLVLSPNEIAIGASAVIKDKDGFLEPINMVSYDVSKATTKLYELKQVCDSVGTEFAYISFPSKTNHETTLQNYGIDTNQQEVRASFLSQLDTYGIHVLNVQELLQNDGYTTKDIFYKTDHHWKSTMGLYAARAIANYLNDTFDYSLRADLLDENLFTYTIFNDLWLGETGRKYSKTWTGVLDDFTKILPVYDTHIEIGPQYGEYDYSGDFSLLINECGYNGHLDLYYYSAHYSYGEIIHSPTWIHNDHAEGKKILIIKDSFSMVVIPFLSLTTSDIAVWDMRVTKQGLYDYIKENDFDIVLVEYTDFWRADMYNFR